jgi:hypothetical protein
LLNHLAFAPLKQVASPGRSRNKQRWSSDGAVLAEAITPSFSGEAEYGVDVTLATPIRKEKN